MKQKQVKTCFTKQNKNNDSHFAICSHGRFSDPACLDKIQARSFTTHFAQCRLHSSKPWHLKPPDLSSCTPSDATEYSPE